MKRSIAFIILAMTCIVTNAQEMTDSLYRAQYKFALSQISPIASQIAGYRDELENVWHEAIYENTYKGEPCDDFNKAVNSYLAERNESFFYFVYLVGVEDVKKQIKKLNNYPPSYEKAFDELIDLGIMIDEFHKKVANPDGSYNEFCDETKDIYTRINRKLYELEMRYTD